MTGTVAPGKKKRGRGADSRGISEPKSEIAVSTLQGPTGEDVGQRCQHGERDSPAQGEEDLRSVSARPL
ncbi:unnamed protein product [Arctogadus glacialis]